MDARPYHFEDAPYLTREAAEIQSALSRLGPLQVGEALAAFLEERPRVRFLGVTAAEQALFPYAPSAVFLHLESGGRARLVIDPRLALFAVERTLGGESERPVPRPLTEAEEGLLSAMLLAALDALPSPASFALAEMGGAPLTGGALALEIELGPVVGWGVLEVEPHLARAFRPRRPLPSWLTHLPLEGRLRVGRGKISAGDLASLQDSDTLVPDELWLDEAGEGRGVLRIAGLFGDVRLQEGRAVLTGGLMPEAGSLAKGASLEVEVELGRFKATLEDIAGWGPGAILPLARRPGDPVDLVAEGRVIARGEIVRVEGELGVRILWVAD